MVYSKKNMSKNETNDNWPIIESYFKNKYLEQLVRHQIESYNQFVNYQIQRTIQMFNQVVIRSENDYVEEQDKYLFSLTLNCINTWHGGNAISFN